MMGIAALNPSYVLLAGACCDEAELPRLRGASHVAAGRWSAARTCDGHGRQATSRRALCRMEEVHALWSALLVGGRATLAPMHPATEQARMQEQARRRRHLKTLHRPYRRQRCSGAQSRRSCAVPSKTVGRKSNGLSQERGHSYPCDLAFNGCRWHPLSFVRLRERSGRLGRRSPHCRR